MRASFRQLSTLFLIIVAVALGVAFKPSEPNEAPKASSPSPKTHTSWKSTSYQDVALMAVWLEKSGVDYIFDEELGEIVVAKADDACFQDALRSDELRGFWYSCGDAEKELSERQLVVKQRTRDWLEWRTDDEIEKLSGLSPALIRVNPILSFDEEGQARAGVTGETREMTHGKTRALRPVPSMWPVPCQPQFNTECPFKVVQISVIVFVPQNPDMFEDEISWPLGLQLEKGDLLRILVIEGQEELSRVCQWARSQRELESRRRPPWNVTFDESAK